MFNIVNDKQTSDELNTSKFFIMMEPFRQCIVALIVQYTKFILKFILVFLGLSASNIHGTKEVHLSEDLTWAVHCDYIMKKVDRRLYTLRQLKKRKVPSADIVHIYCALIRSILEYASAVFADLPKYLACYLENVQKRALSIIWPGISYETALEKAALSTLSDRRAVSCVEFIGKVRPGNPLYPLYPLQNRVVPISISVCRLRSGSSSRPMATRTECFSNFLSVKYQSCQ